MIGYFKIPVKDGYIDVNRKFDSPIKIFYDGNMEFGYVLLDYKEKQDHWIEITEEEFEESTQRPILGLE